MQRMAGRKLRFGCGSSLQSAFVSIKLRHHWKECLTQDKTRTTHVIGKRGHGGNEK